MGRKRTDGKQQAAGVDARRRRFVLEYVKDFNGAQAAIRAGYAKAGAKQTASRLLTDVDLQAQVAALVGKVLHAEQITVERIAAEAAHVAFLDPADLFTDDGTLKALKDMPEGARRAIAGLDIEELYAGSGAEREQVGLAKKLKLVSKMAALGLLADWRGMLKSATMLPPVLHLEIDMTGAKPAKG